MIGTCQKVISKLAKDIVDITDVSSISNWNNPKFNKPFNFAINNDENIINALNTFDSLIEGKFYSILIQFFKFNS
jgi:hypothetical protein